MAVSVRTVDKLAADGNLRRITLPGRTRAAGFLESDLVGLLGPKEVLSDGATNVCKAHSHQRQSEPTH